ncbi:hypothetical protein DGMP_24970 [Desulfomarina profundi]|uniref:Enolpyruvate transferase domain-containing protein n=1 Tax=Desulfomarina profundi TaxID=2772557 RepID=A0A8D5JHR5_9BACT|nr:hypothetical protein DGMP_24970 [Desulfomarina profundi]
MIIIQPAEKKIRTTISVPGSKSLTQRALIAAALADGRSRLIGPLESEDTEYSSGALAQMGIAMEKGDDWLVEGRGELSDRTGNPFFSVTTERPPVFSRPLLLLVGEDLSLTGTRGCMSGPLIH